MKNFLILTLLFISFSAFSADQTFDCSWAEEKGVLVLNENHITFQDHTYTNMLAVDMDLEWRGYTFINDPWMDLTITSKMLNGKDGQALLTVTNLQTDDSVSKGFECHLQGK